MKTSYTLKNQQKLLYCEADSNYTILHFQGGIKKVVSTTLKSVQDSLSTEKFIRIHHKYLVNRSFIQNIPEDLTKVELISGRLLPTSRRKRNQLNSLI